jgi:hypothetical protein
MSRDNLIVAQCCFKGAIDLAIANRISTEEINKLTKVWTDFIIAEYGGGTTAVVPAKPVFQPKENYKGNSDKKPKIANPNDDASEAQLKYINNLIKELPLSEQDAFKQLVSGQVTKGVAHGLIEQLKGKIDDNEPVARTPKSSAEAQF